MAGNAAGLACFFFILLLFYELTTSSFLFTATNDINSVGSRWPCGRPRRCNWCHPGLLVCFLYTYLYCTCTIVYLQLCVRLTPRQSCTVAPNERRSTAEGAQDATQTPTMELEPQQKGLGTQVYNFFLKQSTNIYIDIDYSCHYHHPTHGDD